MKYPTLFEQVRVALNSSLYFLLLLLIGRWFGAKDLSSLSSCFELAGVLFALHFIFVFPIDALTKAVKTSADMKANRS